MPDDADEELLLGGACVCWVVAGATAWETEESRATIAVAAAKNRANMTTSQAGL